jgi:hypothetical protein
MYKNMTKMDNINLESQTVVDFIINITSNGIINRKMNTPCNKINFTNWCKIYNSNIDKKYNIKFINNTMFAFDSFENKCEDECSICQDKLYQDNKIFGKKMLITLDCNNKHRYHMYCISKWVLTRSNDPSCPLCRSSFKADHILSYISFSNKYNLDKEVLEESENIYNGDINF